jgi:hypothetical protein
MAIKYHLKLRSSASPHLYLDTIKGWIKDDAELLPQTRKMLLLMKKWKRSFIQLPLEMDVIVAPEFKCNLERAISPQMLPFGKTNWSDIDIQKYEKDKKKYIADVIELYTKMGFEIDEQAVSSDTLKEIMKAFPEPTK